MLHSPEVAQKHLWPSAVIDLSERDKYILVAALTDGTLQLFENTGNSLDLVLEFPMSIGKAGFGKQIEGDKKTPVGVYRITSFLNDNQLDAFYGRAAYPVDYPNVWDRLQNRTGSGIWLHAMPEGVTSRPPLDSDGCLVINNEQIDVLKPYLDVGRTRIVMTDSNQRVDPSVISQKRELLTNQLMAWKNSWESLSHKQYLDFYSTEFNNFDYNKAAWDTYKKRVNGKKKFINIGISDLAIFEYPGVDNLVMVEFYQSYKSNDYKSNGWKKQLWKEEQNGWKIIYEAGG